MALSPLATSSSWSFNASAGVLLVRLSFGMQPGLLEDGSPLAGEVEGAICLEAARAGCILQSCKASEGRVVVVADVPLQTPLTALASRIKRGAERRLRRRWPGLPSRPLFSRGFLAASLDAAGRAQPETA